jgi:lipid-A-disaccharide synthase
MLVQPWMALPTEELFELAKGMVPLRRSHELPGEHKPPTRGEGIWCRVGDVSDLMRCAHVAIAKSGSVTLECAFHRLPTVVMYRVAWPTWWIARSIVRVPFAAMPNLLAGKEVYPELLQGQAVPEIIAREAEALLRDGTRRDAMLNDLDRVTASLGAPGAADRAAVAILDLLKKP